MSQLAQNRDFGQQWESRLAPLRGFALHFLPTAYAVGFILAPLRGFFNAALKRCSTQSKTRHRNYR